MWGFLIGWYSTMSVLDETQNPQLLGEPDSSEPDPVYYQPPLPRFFRRLRRREWEARVTSLNKEVAKLQDQLVAQQGLIL